MLNNLPHSNSANRLRKCFRTGGVGLALMDLVSPACNANEPEATVPPQTQTEQTGNATVGEVNGDLEQLVGQTITVRSGAEATDDPNSFRLSDNDTLLEKTC